MPKEISILLDELHECQTELTAARDEAERLRGRVSELEEQLDRPRIALLEERRELKARVAELEGCLKEARANMEGWATYVPEYFQEKHGLAEDLAAIDRVIEGQQPASTPE